MDWKDKRVVFSGRLKRRAALIAQLEAAGAVIGRIVSPHTHFFVIGSRPGSRYAMAKTLGVPIINEAQLTDLLAGKEVDTRTPAPHTTQKPPKKPPTNALLSKLRGLLHAEPSRENWGAICKALDVCHADLLPTAVDYVNQSSEGWGGALSSFTIRPAIRSNISPHHHHFHLFPHGTTHNPIDADVVASMPKLDVRLFPLSWQKELLRSDYNPKFQAARVLGFHRVKVTLTVARNIIRCPHLFNLRAIYLHGRRLSPTFIEAFAKHDGFPHLTHLDVSTNPFAERGVRALLASPHLTQLSHLNLSRTEVFNFPDHPLPPNLTSLDISDNFFWSYPNVHTLPHLHTALIARPLQALAIANTDIDANGLRGLLASGALKTVTHLDLSFNRHLNDRAMAILADALPGLPIVHLDVRNTNTRGKGRKALKRVCADKGTRYLSGNSYAWSDEAEIDLTE